jgi:RNA polymerase sigma factor (sigma-70 family)
MDRAAAREQLIAALARVATRDSEALRFVYSATASKLFGVCLRILRDNGEAEDVLQNVYLTIWHQAAKFDPEKASPITWLVAIARNRAIDRLRASATARRMAPLDDAIDVKDDAPGALSKLVAGEEQQRLMDCLNELESRQANAIRVAFLDGVTYEELARRMDVPLGTMKSLIRRALIQLRGCLER